MRARLFLFTALLSACFLSPVRANADLFLYLLERSGFESLAAALNETNTAELFASIDPPLKGVLLAPSNSAMDQAYQAAIGGGATDAQWLNWFSQVIRYHYIDGIEMLDDLFCKPDWTGSVKCNWVEQTVFSKLRPGSFMLIKADASGGAGTVNYFMAMPDTDNPIFTMLSAKVISGYTITTPDNSYSSSVWWYNADSFIVPNGLPEPGQIHTMELSDGAFNETVV